MKRTTVETAVDYAKALLKNVDEPWRALAFPVVLTEILRGAVPVSKPGGVELGSRIKPVAGTVRKPTRSGTLRNLIAEGWFKTQRKLVDIRNELRHRGLPTKTTTLPSLVLPLVLDGKLKRKPVGQGEKEVYVYYS